MQKFTDAVSAENWVMSRHNSYIPYEKYAEALAKVGNPQNQIKTIHVAGTNGKGSVCYGLCCGLMAMGKKVGMFTSPHLVSHRDRIRIQNEWIDEETYVRLLNNRLELIEEYQFAMFQINFLLACDWFLEQQVDYAIMEVGIGGLLDTTNIIDCPRLAIITGIGLDHMAILGNTLEEIAEQKAGIIKPSCDVVLGKMPSVAVEVMKKVAYEKKALLHLYEPYQDEKGRQMIWRNERYEIGSYAHYQKQNMAVVLNALSILGYDPFDPRIHASIKNDTWPGRFEIMSKEPLLIIDGAHNMDGMTALTSSLKDLPRPIIAVYSALRDKQGPEMRDLLAKYVDQIILTTIQSGRADNPVHLSETDEVIEDYRMAITEAEERAGKQGSVLVCGSLYLISDVRNWLLSRE